MVFIDPSTNPQPPNASFHNIKCVSETRLRRIQTIQTFVFFQVLIIPRILESSQDESASIIHRVGLCVGLFLTECLKSLSLSACWIVNQRTGIRFQTAVCSLAFEKLMRFKSLTHITSGEVGTWGCTTRASYHSLGVTILGTVPGEGEGELREGEEEELNPWVEPWTAISSCFWVMNTTRHPCTHTQRAALAF